MRVNTLGSVEVESDGVVVNVGGKQQRRLLGFLVVQRGRPVSTERLVDAVWPDGDAPAGSVRSMRTYVSRLRSVLPAGSVVSRHGAYSLCTDALTIDVDDFDRLLARAESSAPDVALACYDEALDLWRGVPFGEFADEWWAIAEAKRLLERRALADEGRACALMALGHHNRAIPELEHLVAEHPLREQPVRLLMQALQVTGRRSEAMRAARAFRARLGEQTGLDPSAELTQLESAIAADTEPSTAAHDRPLRGYTMHQAIGEGAYGRVYAATQPGTERPVAIKVIRPDLADSSEFIRRFDVEARLVARLEHPHIVPLYDYWREPGGAYLVFRLLTGGTARDSVISGGPWSLGRVSRFVEEIGGALMSAHAAGVVHNDVKASNVLLDDDGAVYLTDFGIAIVEAADAAEAADVGDPVGGARRRRNDDAERGDVRDLGWTTWELLTGSCHAPRSSRSSMARRSHGGPVPPLIGRMSTVPDGLEAVLARATAGQGGYATVADFLLGWRAATAHLDGRAAPITSSERQLADSARRHAVQALHLAASAGINPYRGLRSFDEEDAARFHGRSTTIDDLVNLVATSDFVTVIGSSGSGKSSVVRAGLVPRLRSMGHAVVTLVPGDDPLGALIEALGDVTTLAEAETFSSPHDAIATVARRFGKLAIVVDQFEECWTRSDDAAREAFLHVVDRTIVDESVDVVFVTTVRADLSDRPLEHPTLGHRLTAGAYVLATLSPSEYDEVIVSPSADVGVGFDDGVVADLIAEAITQPGSLPLLQFTLTELYDRRVDGMISEEALERIGGMAGAIGRRADEVFAELDDSSRSDARVLFGRLVTPGDGTPDARRRARRSELSPGMQSVADRFVDARLLTADRDPVTREPTIEVAHEALLSRWDLLAGWVAEDRRWLAQLQHLSDAARAWDADGRSDNELYRGARLEAAIEAIHDDGRAVSDVERDFIEAGRSSRDAAIRASRRTARRLRRLLVAAAVALIVALVAGAIAVVQRGQADANAAEAQIEALVGRAESLRQTQRDTAALLAVEAYRLADTPRTRSALLSTFTADPTFYDARRIPDIGGAGIVMPDGESAYVVDEEGRVRSYGLETGSLGDPFPAVGDMTAGASVLAASDDGRWLAQAWRSNLGGVRTAVGVFDTSTGSLRFAPLTVDGAVWSMAFTPDAVDLALAIDEEARLLVVDSATGAEQASAPGVAVPALGGEVGLEPQAGGVGPTPRPPAVVISGDELLLGAADGSLRAFDAETFEPRRLIELAPDTLASMRALEDGTLLTAGRRGMARVDPVDGGERWRHDQGLSDIGDGASGATCRHLALFEQTGRFYCANAFGRLAEYDLASGYTSRVLDAQNGNTGPLWPARDGTELVSFGDNEDVVSRWRLDGSGPITHVVAPGFRGFSFNHGGDLLLVEQGHAFEGLPAHVIDVATGDVVRVLEGLINAEWLDEDTVAGALINDAGQVETALVDLPFGDLMPSGFVVDPIPDFAGRLPGQERWFFVYHDGTDGTLRQFDADAQRFGPDIHVEDMVSRSISRSGHRIAAGTKGGAEFYDGFTGEQVGRISGDDLRSVFITVTDQLFVGSLGGELTMYDLDSLERIRSFGGSRGSVSQLLGTADGSLIATNGGDHNVILYDVESGVSIGTPITIADEESNIIALSLDGRWLSVGGEAADGSHATKIWNLDPETWTAAACNVAGRNLTRDEWASNIGELAAYRPTCPQFPSEV
jgi:DNA-binding SARP family transcriptional activator/WD40 repeat protein